MLNPNKPTVSWSPHFENATILSEENDSEGHHNWDIFVNLTIFVEIALAFAIKNRKKKKDMLVAFNWNIKFYSNVGG